MRLSLRTRIIALVLITAFAVVVATVFTVQRTMLSGYETLATEREQSELERIAIEVTLSLQQRALALEAFAARMLSSSGELLDAAELQKLLHEPSVAKSLFPDGLLAFDADATAIAQSVYVPGRIGTNYADRAHFQHAKQTKTPVISEPLLGRVTGLPLISFLQPILSPTGDIIGYAGGILDLSTTPLLAGSSTNLDKPSENNLSLSNGAITLIIDPQHRLFVHMQQRFETPEPLPAVGKDALVDAAISKVPSGSIVPYQGHNYVLATKVIEPLGWVILRAVPHQELTVPAQAAFGRLLWVTLIIVLIAGIGGVWAAHRVMRPLSRVTARIESMADDARLDSEFEERGSPEVKALARAMNRLADERKLVDQLKDSFVATVSHELRTPLASLSGGIKLLEGHAAKEASKPAKNLLALCSRNADRLTLLINDLLEFSQVMAGKTAIELTTCNLTELAEQATQDMEAKAVEHRISFTLSIPANAHVIGDTQRLRQVIDNLLSNAIKYSPATGTVTLTAVQSTPECWRLTVSDEGPGVPTAFAARIFQPFSQAETGDKRYATGTVLGLAISKAFIEQMKGSIGYYNNQGAHFWIELEQANNLVGGSQ